MIAGRWVPTVLIAASAEPLADGSTAWPLAEPGSVCVGAKEETGATGAGALGCGSGTGLGASGSAARSVRGAAGVGWSRLSAVRSKSLCGLAISAGAGAAGGALTGAAAGALGAVLVLALLPVELVLVLWPVTAVAAVCTALVAVAVTWSITLVTGVVTALTVLVVLVTAVFTVAAVWVSVVVRVWSTLPTTWASSPGRVLEELAAEVTVLVAEVVPVVVVVPLVWSAAATEVPSSQAAPASPRVSSSRTRNRGTRRTTAFGTAFGTFVLATAFTAVRPSSAARRPRSLAVRHAVPDISTTANGGSAASNRVYPAKRP
jgi:hypothetical protein